jgi:hypothetical protein
MKLAAGLAGLAAAGVVLVFTQFMTLGLLALSLGGGALLGYVLRARQNRLPGQRNASADAIVERAPGREDAARLPPPVEEAQRKRSR